MKTNKNISKQSNCEKGSTAEESQEDFLRWLREMPDDDWIIESCRKADEYQREQARKQAKKLLPWAILILLPFIVCLVLLYIYDGIGAVVGAIGAIFIVFTICVIFIR